MSRWFRPTVPLLAGIRNSLSFPIHLCIREQSLLTRKFPVTPTSVLVASRHASTSNGRTDPEFLLANYLTVRDQDFSEISAHSLKSLYLGVKQRNRLCRLNAKQMTFMISLFGSISTPKPQRASIYVLDSVPYVDISGEQTFWPFILEIARDKLKLQYRLNGIDRFWIMRAELAILYASPRMSTERVEGSISRAKKQYARIWRHTADPEVHAPLLEALITSSSPKHISEALKYMCRILALYNYPHRRLVDVFWKIVLQHGATLSSDQKATILSLCHTRVGRFNERSGKQMTSAFQPTTIGMPTLGASLADRLFPQNFCRLLPDPMHHWVEQISTNAFQPSIPLEARWSNLILLAVCVNPNVSQPASLSNINIIPELTEWRTVLILAALEYAVSEPRPESASHKLDKILQPLWRLWQGIEVDRPLLASQVVVASFMRLAVVAKNGELFQGCARYGIRRELWSTSQGSSEAGCIHILTSYLIGLVKCQGQNWPHILHVLDTTSLAHAWRSKVLNALFCHFATRDTMAAHDFYQTLQSSVAASQSLSPYSIERLLTALLRSLKSTSPKFVSSDLAATICSMMETLYAEKVPPPQLKYPIRFCIPLMISSGYVSKAVNITKTLARHSPPLFTPRFFARLIRLLVRCRQFAHAHRVLQLAQEVTPSRTINIVHTKLVILLARAGATKLAQSLDPIHDVTGPLYTRLSIVRAIGFRCRHPTPHATLRVLRILSRNPSDRQAIRNGIVLLVRARRITAAMKLLQSKCATLSPESIAESGNTILHGFLQRGQRNGRLVERVLRTKDLLEKTCGFTPDPVTSNIIIKAMLQWRLIVGTSQVKSLFDHIIRLGYPSGSHLGHKNIVPFGTEHSKAKSLELPALTSQLSFKRHVQPLYKTFIKAFYTRGDPDAAKIVIRILKEEQIRLEQESSMRQGVRLIGIYRGKHQSTMACVG